MKENRTYLLLTRPEIGNNSVLRLDLGEDVVFRDRVKDITDESDVEFMGYESGIGFKYGIYRKPCEYLALDQARGEPIAIISIREGKFNFTSESRVKNDVISEGKAITLAEENRLERILD